MITASNIHGHKFLNKGNISYKIKVSSHFRQTRKNEVRKRGFMFKTIGQVERILLYAMRNRGIEDFIDKKRVVIKFSYFGEIYGLLISLDSSKIKNNLVEITLITVDKEDTRHYTEHLMFMKEDIRIDMSEYELFSTSSKYIKDFSICTLLRPGKTSAGACVFAYAETAKEKVSRFFKSIGGSTNFTESVAGRLLSFEEEIFFKIRDNGPHFIEAHSFNGDKYVVKFSFEKITRKKYAFIFLNICEDTEFIKEKWLSEGCSKYLDLPKKIYGSPKRQFVKTGIKKVS